jgi:hypothetical protein
MAPWIEDKNFNLSSIRWKLWSRKKTMSDFTLSAKKLIKQISTTIKLQTSKSPIFHILLYTIITWMSTKNAAGVTKSYGQL